MITIKLFPRFVGPNPNKRLIFETARELAVSVPMEVLLDAI